jgi:osmotically-inducible protein OsmY
MMKNKIEIWTNRVQRSAAIVCVCANAMLVGMLASGCAGDRYHESTGESIDDTATTARVKSALGSDPTFKFDNIHVTTFKGNVQLSGFVASSDARSHAISVTRNTEGVKDVTNSIEVRD